MTPPFIRENSVYTNSIPRFEVIDYNELGHLHVAFGSNVESLCQDYINNL